MQRNKFLNLLFTPIICCLLAGCASMNGASFSKKIFRFNISGPKEGALSDDLKKQIGDTVTVLPFIDRRKAEEVNFAFQKQLSIVTRDFLIAELKKSKLFKKVDVSDDALRINTDKNIIYGIIDAFKMSFDETSITKKEDSGVVHKTLCTYKGRIIYIGSDGRAIVHECLGTAEIYLPFQYFKDNYFYSFAPDSNLPDSKYDEFNDVLSNMFTSVMSDACKDLSSSNEFVNNYIEPDTFANTGEKYMDYGKFNELVGNETKIGSLSMLGGSVLGVLVGSIAGNNGNIADDPALNGELGAIYGMFFGAGAGAIVGLILDQIFMTPEFQKASFYADYPHDGNKGLILCRNF
jgi:hypothetical protein